MMSRTQLEKLLIAAEKASAKAAEKRAALPAGASRASVTTANAKWARAAEYRDTLRKQVEALP